MAVKKKAKKITKKVVARKKIAKKKIAPKKVNKKKVPKKVVVKKSTKKVAKKSTSKKIKPKKVVPVATTLEEQAALNSITQDVFAEFHEKKSFRKEKLTENKKVKKENPKVSINKKFKVILLAIIILVIGVYFFIKIKLDNTLPVTDGKLSLNGLSKEVIVYRDKMGIPLIKAKHELDLFLATGFVMSQDRLWQMEVMRLIGRGELSTLGGKKALTIDLFMRTVGTRKNAQKTFAKLTPKYKKILQQFVKGVNAFIKSQTLPPEFLITGHQPKPWQAIDPLYIFQVLSLGLSNNFIEELAFLEMKKRLPANKAAYLFPIYPDTPIPFDEANKLKTKNIATINSNLIKIFDDIESYISIGQAGSNNWALAGSRTKSGKVIVANDTHLRLSLPSAWMIMQLQSPEYSASGFMLPGVPLVALGYNGTFSWGATMVMADSQDLFIEKIKTINGELYYLYKKNWLKLKKRKEIFEVKGEKTIERYVYSTIHGPLLNEVMFQKKLLPFQAPKLSDKQYQKNNNQFSGVSLAWAAHLPDNSLQGIYNLAGARTVKQVQRALSDLDGIYLNIVYGDKDNIGWQVTGRYPLRKKGTGLLPSPGHLGEYDWQGFLPYDKHPHKINPQDGYVATANHRVLPYNSKINLSQTWRVPERMERIRNLILKGNKADLKTTQIMQADQKSRFVVKFLRQYIKNKTNLTKLKDAKLNANDKARLVVTIKMLSNFNAVMKKESNVAALMGAFYHTINHKLFKDELGYNTTQWAFMLALNDKSYSAWHDHVLYRPESPFWDNITTKQKESRFDIIAQALIDAYQLCEQKLGKDNKIWQWGNLHNYTWRHSISKSAKFLSSYLNIGPYPAGGDTFTLNNSGSTWGKDFDAWFVPAMRMISDYSKKEPFHVITTHGQSGNPSSKHYDSMISKWLNITHHNLKFSLDNWSPEEKQKKLILY